MGAPERMKRRLRSNSFTSLSGSVSGSQSGSVSAVFLPLDCDPDCDPDSDTDPDGWLFTAIFETDSLIRALVRACLLASNENKIGDRHRIAA